MKYIIHSAEDIGLALRAVRKSARLRLDDLSRTVGVSKQTTTNLEQGKPTVQLGTVLGLLREVGLTVSLNLPDSALPALRRVQDQAGKRAQSRADPSPEPRGTAGAARRADNAT